MKISTPTVFLSIVLSASLCFGARKGANGINSAATGLDGSGVLIGMVEFFRPGKHGYESALLSVPHVMPAKSDFPKNNLIGQNSPLQ